MSTTEGPLTEGDRWAIHEAASVTLWGSPWGRWDRRDRVVVVSQNQGPAVVGGTKYLHIIPVGRTELDMFHDVEVAVIAHDIDGESTTALQWRVALLTYADHADVASVLAEFDPTFSRPGLLGGLLAPAERLARMLNAAGDTEAVAA